MCLGSYLNSPPMGGSPALMPATAPGFERQSNETRSDVMTSDNTMPEASQEGPFLEGSASSARSSIMAWGKRPRRRPLRDS